MTGLVPMSEPEYRLFVEESISAYAASKVAAGQWPQAESLELSRKTFNQLLPQGLATPGHFIFSITNERAERIGVLWFAVQNHAERIAYVYEVSIKPAHQRKGHATRAFQLLEIKVRELGLAGIALHVFGHNTGARTFYAKLGYHATNINLYKKVAY